MTSFQKLLLLCCFIYFQGCASIQPTKPARQDTGAASPIDGAWINTSCKCSGNDTKPTGMQGVHILIVNGNLMFQDLMARYKRPEWKSYCNIHEEATLTQSAENTYDVATLSERTFSSGGVQCEITPTKEKRTWKIHTVGKSQLTYESTSGCGTGPLVCDFQRLEK